MKLLILGGGRRLAFCKRLIDYGYELALYELNKDNPVSATLGCETICGMTWTHQLIREDIAKAFVDTNSDFMLPLDCAAVNICGRKYYSDPILFREKSIVSCKETTEICHDKRLLASTFSAYPELKEFYPSPELDKRFVKKPRHGYGSNGVSFGEYYKTGYDTENVYQKYLPGKEFSVDCWFSKFTSKLVNVCVRERVRVCGSEVVESITVNRPDIISAIKVIAKRINFCGPICMQFKDDEYGMPFIMEINGRVGGGTTLSIESGLDIPKYIEDEYFKNKKAVKPSYCEVGVKMIRAFSDSFFRG